MLIRVIGTFVQLDHEGSVCHDWLCRGYCGVLKTRRWFEKSKLVVPGDKYEVLGHVNQQAFTKRPIYIASKVI